MESYDYFQPHTFIRHLVDDFATFKEAVFYLHGLRLATGKFVKVSSLQESTRPYASEKEEERLAWCLLAEQHELTHVFQFASTTFGILTFILEAMLSDIERGFVRTLSSHTPTPVRQLSSRPELAKITMQFLPMQRLLRSQLSAFDQPNVTEATAVEHWNRAMDLLDACAQDPNDDLRFVRFRNGRTEIEANPGYITSRSLIECSARCRDIGLLSSWHLKERVLDRLSLRLFSGKEYTILFGVVNDLFSPATMLRGLARLCGLALQPPLVSIHAQSNHLENMAWEDIAPGSRFLRIVEYVRSSDERPEAILEDPGFPDRVCEALEWPTQQSIFKQTRDVSFFQGTDALTRFVTRMHLEFCHLALTHPAGSCWLLDLALHPKYALQLNMETFYPPFHFAGGDFVIHPTGTDFKEIIEILLVHATTVAANEILHHRFSLARTKVILASFARWASERNEDAAKTFSEIMVPAAFKQLLGVYPDELKNLDRSEPP